MTHSICDRPKNRPVLLLSTMSWVAWMCLPGWGQENEQEKELTNLTTQEYQAALDRSVDEGLVPISAGVRVVRNKPLFNIKFGKRNPQKPFQVAHHDLTEKRYQELKKTYRERGFSEYLHRVYFIDLQRRHLTYWEKDSAAEKPAATHPTFLTEPIWDADTEVPIEGKRVPQAALFDQMMVDFLKKHQIPGAQLVITYNGKNILSRGYGYADLAAKEKMKPGSLMRIGNLSKPITAAAIMRLVDSGKLKLDDRPARLLDLQALDESKIDPRFSQITIRHLLHHTAGFDSNQTPDPVFRPSQVAKATGSKHPLSAIDYLQYRLSLPLDFDPGSQFAYSHVNYSMLGRIIEKVSGAKYEKFVQKEIFAPLDIKKMRIGKSAEEDRAPDEVVYYTRHFKKYSSVVGDVGKPVPIHYGPRSLAAADSAMGWIGSAEDISRFGLAFGNPNRCPFLSRQATAAVFQRPDYFEQRGTGGKVKPRYHGIGWQLDVKSKNRVEVRHFGIGAGCSSVFRTRLDGFSYVAMFNCRRSENTKEATFEIEKPIYQTLSRFKQQNGIK